MRSAVEANNGFAADLYQRLAAENAGRNIFVSPYSIFTALSMTAEGARGETAQQMGQTLHFPQSLRQTGDERDARPWAMAALHQGLASIAARLGGAEPKALAALKEKISRLRAELAKANEEATRLRGQGKFMEHLAAAQRSQRIAGQLNPLLQEVDPYEIRSANALWGERSCPFQPEYVATINRYYGTGGVFPVDFKRRYEAVRIEISLWR